MNLFVLRLITLMILFSSSVLNVWGAEDFRDSLAESGSVLLSHLNDHGGYEAFSENYAESGIFDSRPFIAIPQVGDWEPLPAEASAEASAAAAVAVPTQLNWTDYRVVTGQNTLPIEPVVQMMLSLAAEVRPEQLAEAIVDSITNDKLKQLTGMNLQTPDTTSITNSKTAIVEWIINQISTTDNFISFEVVSQALCSALYEKYRSSGDPSIGTEFLNGLLPELSQFVRQTLRVLQLSSAQTYASLNSIIYTKSRQIGSAIYLQFLDSRFTTLLILSLSAEIQTEYSSLVVSSSTSSASFSQKRSHNDISQEGEEEEDNEDDNPPRRKIIQNNSSRISQSVSDVDEQEEGPSSSEEDEPVPSKNKKMKIGRITTNDHTPILRTWFEQHLAHPYIKGKKEAASLAAKAGISVKQLNNWLTNNRKRVWQPQLCRATEDNPEDFNAALTQLRKDWAWN
ncbi:MAG: homeobox domain-containing protein [Oligoflexia bacterium]|nr:homeobox domain-containing protein [Oligoflexia bacterium]